MSIDFDSAALQTQHEEEDEYDQEDYAREQEVILIFYLPRHVAWQFSKHFARSDVLFANEPALRADSFFFF